MALFQRECGRNYQLRTGHQFGSDRQYYHIGYSKWSHRDSNIDGTLRWGKKNITLVIRQRA